MSVNGLYGVEWNNILAGVSRSQLAHMLKSGVVPNNITIPWRFAFTLEEASFIDKQGTMHQEAFDRIRGDLDRFERWPRGQQIIRDMLLHPRVHSPVAIRTEFSRKSPPETLPRESVGIYALQYNEIVFDTKIMSSFDSGPFGYTGLGHPFVVLAHEIDHMLRMSRTPMDIMIPQPIIISLYEKLARNNEQQALEELNRQGFGPYRSRDNYFEHTPYIKSLVERTPTAVLQQFVTRSGTAATMEENLLNMFTHRALYNDGYKAIESVLGVEGAAALLPIGPAQPPRLSPEQQDKLARAFQEVFAKAEETAQQWLLETRRAAENSLRARTGQEPIRYERRGDAITPGLPKLNVTLADDKDGTDTGLPAHLRTPTARSII